LFSQGGPTPGSATARELLRLSVDVGSSATAPSSPLESQDTCRRFLCVVAPRFPRFGSRAVRARAPCNRPCSYTRPRGLPRCKRHPHDGLDPRTAASSVLIARRATCGPERAGCKQVCPRRCAEQARDSRPCTARVGRPDQSRAGGDSSRLAVQSAGGNSGGRRRQLRALRAARCSASFLLRPQAGGNWLSPTWAAILKHLLWSGPFSSSSW